MLPAFRAVVAEALGAGRHLDIDVATPFPMAGNGGGTGNGGRTDNATEIQALEADRGNYLGYMRLAGRLRADARLDEPIVSIPSGYVKSPCSAFPRSLFVGDVVRHGVDTQQTATIRSGPDRVRSAPTLPPVSRHLDREPVGLREVDVQAPAVETVTAR